MASKKVNTKYLIDSFHFENDIHQYIDVRIDYDGYIELDMETSTKYSIDTQAEIDLIYQKLTEALKIAQSYARISTKRTVQSE